MDTIEASSNAEVETSSVVGSLTHLLENSSALGFRLVASKDFCNYVQNNLKILETKIQFSREAKNYAMKTRDELLTRNRINTISLESLFHVQNELHTYKSEVKAEYIKTEEAMKSKRMKYDKIINSYKMKWEAAEQEYQKLPMAAEVSELDAEIINYNVEARKLQDLLIKTKAEYTEKYIEMRFNLSAKILDLAKEFRTYIKFVRVTDEIRQKNIQLQELLLKLQNCESAQVICQYSNYSKPSSLCINIQSNRKEKDVSSFPFDLTSFDEVFIPPENLEMEPEDESFFYSDESGTNIEVTQNTDSVTENSAENIGDSMSPLQNNVEFQDNYFSEKDNSTKVDEHDPGAAKDSCKDPNEAIDIGSDPNFTTNEVRSYSNNQCQITDVNVSSLHQKTGGNEAGEELTSKNIVNLPKFNLKERRKKINAYIEEKDVEYAGGTSKKGKYPFNKNTRHSQQVSINSAAEVDNNHLPFHSEDRGKKNCLEEIKTNNTQNVASENKINQKSIHIQENFLESSTNQENNEEKENNKFLFFLDANSNRSESASIFNLF